MLHGRKEICYKKNCWTGFVCKLWNKKSRGMIIEFKMNDYVGLVVLTSLVYKDPYWRRYPQTQGKQKLQWTMKNFLEFIEFSRRLLIIRDNCSKKYVLGDS